MRFSSFIVDNDGKDLRVYNNAPTKKRDRGSKIKFVDVRLER